MKRFAFLLPLICLTACHTAPQTVPSSDRLQQGDLLFCVETDTEGLGGAIADVTQGFDSQRISHVAIALSDTLLLEATPRSGVRLCPLSQFREENPVLLLGRLRDTTGVAASLQRAATYLGLPYDTLYLPGTSAIYCSELVQLSYLRPDGTSVFPTQPMTFRDATGQIAPYWVELYSHYDMEVPEGWPGTNPGGLSRDTSLVISTYPPSL